MKKDSKHSNEPTPSPQGRVGVGTRADVALKICGMNLNTLEVAALQPDYLGFIFWEPSKRRFEGTMPEPSAPSQPPPQGEERVDGAMPKIPAQIKKIGVFVDASIADILEKINRFGLWAVQLHGKESSEYCRELKEEVKNTEVKIIKVFSIKDDFDFSALEPYEDICDYFLFDTKGKLPGGNGYTFDWKVLTNYPSTKPYFLSGGIGLDEVDKIKDFLKSPESKYCHAIDVNSRFETEPGLKDIGKLKEFMKSIEY